MMHHRDTLVIGFVAGCVLGLVGIIIVLTHPTVITKTETVTKTVTVTPSSCMAAIEQDNAWFLLIEQSLGDEQWDRLSNNMSVTVGTRNANVNDCRAHLTKKGEN